MIATQTITLLILLILSGFFSGVETALMSVSNIKVKALLKQRKRGSSSLAKLKKNPHKLIITILIGNNIVNIFAASLATVLATNLFGSNGVGIATGVMTLLILIFGEITPKTLAVQNSEKISLLVARPIHFLSIILTPAIWAFSLISNLMSKILGSKEDKKLSEEELKALVTMGAEEGILEKEAAEMMHNILKFKDTRAIEIMTPKARCEMVDGSKSIEEILDYVVKTPYSRYPVYEENKDKIVGILDVDDVLRYVKNKKINTKVENVAHKANFIPESKEIDDLLTELEGKEIPMTMVVDEYGTISGLVTVEDILEEIVGDIFDKSKKESLYIKKARSGLAKVDARAPINEVNDSLKLSLRDEKADTIAGYMEDKMQKIPRKGDHLKEGRADIEVERATKQKIESVKIKKS